MNLDPVIVLLQQQLAALQALADRPGLPLEPVQNDHFEQNERGYHRDGGGNKPSKRLLATIKWIEDHDKELKLSIREIAAGAGVSVGTAQAAKKRIEETA